MDSVLLGAVVTTFLILTTVFTLAFRHAGQIDKERHVK